MFRRVEDSLEADPSFPKNLKQLGFFVNDVGHIRMIEAPEKQYVYHSTNNERVNEVRREAMQACQREETEKRLSTLGIDRVYFPDFTTSKPTGPHVPILSPPPKVLKTRKRVIVLVNDAIQDLGILAYRQLQRELGINGGSVVNFVKEIIKRSATEHTADQGEKIFADGFQLQDDYRIPALVVLNTGQLLFSHKHNQAMTMRSWSSMPRKSVAHDMIRIHEEENRIKGHHTPKEHVKTVFDEVICDPTRVAPDAEVYVIALEDGTESILHLLEEDFKKYSSRIAAMALVHSTLDGSHIRDPNLKVYLHQRTRQWNTSDISSDPLHCIGLPDDYATRPESSSPERTHPIMKSAKQISWSEDLPKSNPVAIVTNTLNRLALAATALKSEDISSPLASETSTDWLSGQGVICPTFAGGDNSVGECVLTDPTVQHAILSFFEEVAQDPEHYYNPPLKIYTAAPQPTPDNPFSLSLSEDDFPSLPREMTPEHAALDEARATLADLHIALAACPTNAADLAKGRAKLAKKVRNKIAEIEELEKKALVSGGLRAGEAVEKRENWKPQGEGLKVPFAGTTVDSELLKAVGLFEAARVGVEEVEGDGDEEKAFV